MDLLPLKLSIARKSGNAFPSSGDARYEISAELKQKVLERDDHTCRYCNFRSEKYQDISFINGKEGDENPKNLATSCIFCHQCMNLDRIHVMRSGVLVWLPELSQAQLHHVARAIYVARISQGPMADTARQSLDMLIHRRDEARKRLHTDDPNILSMVLSDYISAKSYEMRGEKLDGIRLFPLDRRIIKEADMEFNQFPQILAYWRSKNGPFGGKLPREWVNLYSAAMKGQRPADQVA